ncbi:MAG: type II toxin-antitoxin system Phd/YefM family antitoxin [Raoultibacter sp.]
MPKIISSSTLRNKYNEVSTLCHTTQEPVFITKNGAGDLALLSLDAYEQFVQTADLSAALAQGATAEAEGRMRPSSQVIADLRKLYS